MASPPSQSNNARELLMCGVCEEPYDDNIHQAKFMTCHHTFCLQCLTKLSDKGKVPPAVIKCPNCRSLTRVPNKGVVDLQTNFYITNFQEFSANIQPPKDVANMQGCPGHSTQPIEYFCVTCGLSICRDCISINHVAKNGHSVINISKADTTFLEELNVSHESLGQHKRNLHVLESEIALLKAAKDTAIKELETFIKLVHEQLEQRKHDLTKQLMTQFTAQKCALLNEQKHIQRAIKILNTDLTKAKIITRSGDFGKLKPVIESLKKIHEKAKSVSSSLDLGENCLAVDSNHGLDEFSKCLSTLGQIYTRGFLPTKIALRNIEATAGLKATLTVEVYNHKGNKLPMSSAAYSVKVTDPKDTEIPALLCADGSDNIVTFTPQICGLHEVSVVFQGQKLNAEPTHVSVNKNTPVLTFGGRGDGNGQFDHPWSIVIDDEGCLYVTDAINKRIQKFTAEGEYLSQFSVDVHNKDNTTCGIALDPKDGLIYCPEILLRTGIMRQGNNILAFNCHGELQHTYPLSVKDGSPLFIAINSSKHMIISDFREDTVSKINKHGRLLCTLGHLKSPGYVAINKENAMVVSDIDDDKICIFHPNGKLKQKFGSSGCGKGQLKEPWGVATDDENILVSEAGNKRIQVFRYDGTFVSVIESGEPLSPRGLAVTKDGYVYVVDWGNHCVKKYKYKDIP